MKKLTILISLIVVSHLIFAQTSEINNMKFEKLKRLYEFINEFECEVILEIQNVPVPCKFKQYEDIDEKIELLQKGDLDLILFEPGFEVGSKYIQIDSAGSIYMKSSRNEKIIIANNLDEFFSKFRISFQNLPKVEDVLRKKRYVTLYLDEQYTKYDIAKLIEQAASESTSKIKVKHITESKDNELKNYIEITNNEIIEKVHFDLKSGSFIDYLDKELNPFLNDIVKCDFKFTIVHENVWDNRAKVVLVNSEEYESLKDANLIMEEVNLMIN
ncbi:MAG: hypothetical protein ACI8VT_002814 [Saprospiraceae bacterium]|jgi:hypothetical protein